LGSARRFTLSHLFVFQRSLQVKSRDARRLPRRNEDRDRPLRAQSPLHARGQPGRRGMAAKAGEIVIDIFDGEHDATYAQRIRPVCGSAHR
jgi:hypothetical protein